MQVYIRRPEGEGLVPCELTGFDDKLTAALHGGGREESAGLSPAAAPVALRGEGWELHGYTAALYDAEGNALDRGELRAALLRAQAQALWDQLREAGLLDGLLASARLLTRLLDALEGVPLLKSIIVKLRETEG